MNVRFRHDKADTLDVRVRFVDVRVRFCFDNADTLDVRVRFSFDKADTLDVGVRSLDERVRFSFDKADTLDVRVRLFIGKADSYVVRVRFRGERADTHATDVRFLDDGGAFHAERRGSMTEKPQALEVDMDGLELLARAHEALRVTGVDLANLLGISPRTLRRWYAKRTSMGDLAELVPHLLPVDPRLAARVHAHATRQLTSAGLPPPPPLPAPRAELRPVVEPPAPPAPVDAPPPPTELRVDGVVYAACAAIAVPPGDVLRALHAAFRRARELGLTVDDVERELSSRAKPQRARRA